VMRIVARYAFSSPVRGPSAAIYVNNLSSDAAKRYLLSDLFYSIRWYGGRHGHGRVNALNLNAQPI
jgi:hypothetical protein